MNTSSQLKIIDTHTGGEPTRVVTDGFPDLGNGTLVERRDRFKKDFDSWRAGIVNEPRGSDVWVGALICEPHDSSCTAGVIFFNNVGVLGMCGHGTIGVAVALAHLGRLEVGRHHLETPVGVVTIDLHQDREHVTIENVKSYRFKKDVEVSVEGYGAIRGDVAWGGNWFYLVQDHGQDLHIRRVQELTQYSLAVRDALVREGITGANGEEIDHVELFSEPDDSANHSKNFVLCPGAAYDRSPCGTGTSAKLACLVEDGKVKAGEVWRQESIIGSVMEAKFQQQDSDGVIPILTGSAWVNAESTLIFNPNDPFCFGIPQ